MSNFVFTPLICRPRTYTFRTFRKHKKKMDTTFFEDSITISRKTFKYQFLVNSEVKEVPVDFSDFEEFFCLIFIDHFGPLRG